MKHLETTVEVRDSSFRSAPLRMTLKGYKASGDWDFKTCVYTVALLAGRGLGVGFLYLNKARTAITVILPCLPCLPTPQFPN